MKREAACSFALLDFFFTDRAEQNLITSAFQLPCTDQYFDERTPGEDGRRAGQADCLGNDCPAHEYHLWNVGDERQSTRAGH